MFWAKGGRNRCNTRAGAADSSAVTCRKVVGNPILEPVSLRFYETRGWENPEQNPAFPAMIQEIYLNSMNYRNHLSLFAGVC